MTEKHQYRMGVVGNCSYMAYIDSRANVRWMCLPRFDSSFVFGSLLDEKKGGAFSITPAGEFTSKQYYIKNTNILCTEFTAPDGRFRVVDFAPRFSHFARSFRPLMLVRKLELLEGNPAIRVACRPVSNYGESIPEQQIGSNHIRYEGSGFVARLTADLSLTAIQGQKVIVLHRTHHLVFTYGVPLEGPLKETAEDFLRKTTEYWQEWIKSSYMPDIYQKEIIRSALILKLHQYEDTGGIIASGTTSLPEHNGSNRTWDYRYCWFRDAYYTLKAFHEIGHFDELEKYFEFTQNILLNEEDRIQPLYSIAGAKDLDESHLPLEGYLGNQPVRVGNNACVQVQNDVYGQILVSLLPLYVDNRLVSNRSGSYIVMRLLDWIEKTMAEPDAGLWEFRNVKQVHSYTMLFHWAGCKAAGRIAEAMEDTGMKARALSLEKRSVAAVESCYSSEHGAYMQAQGSNHLDASTLKMITMNYLNPGSEKAMTHLSVLERHLKTEQGLFYRYVHPDDFGKPKSTFLICAFWYADALAAVGRTDDAIATLDQILSFRNELGLFSEDIGLDGSQWGNYPQTYSHVGLINAAFRISRKLDQPNFR